MNEFVFTTIRRVFVPFLEEIANTKKCIGPRHRRRKYGGSSPNSLLPISYFGSIWELYVLDLKTNIFCRKNIQLHFSMNKGLTVPKCPPNFSPICLPKPRSFEFLIKSSLRCPCLEPIEGKSLRFQKNPVFVWFSMFVFT